MWAFHFTCTGKLQATHSKDRPCSRAVNPSVTLLIVMRKRLIAQGDRATIESASATTRNGGPITASGSIRLDPAGGFPGDIRIRGQNAELMQSALATAVLGLDLDISGPLGRYPRIGGRVDINSLEIAIPDRLPGSLQPLPGTRHIDPGPTAAARLAIAAKSGRGRGAPAFDAALDLTIAVPGQIRVRGRGLDAQLGGNLNLTGTLAQPKPVGAFNLVRGAAEHFNVRTRFDAGQSHLCGRSLAATRLSRDNASRRRVG